LMSQAGRCHWGRLGRTCWASHRCVCVCVLGVTWVCADHDVYGGPGGGGSEEERAGLHTGAWVWLVLCSAYEYNKRGMAEGTLAQATTSLWVWASPLPGCPQHKQLPTRVNMQAAPSLLCPACCPFPCSWSQPMSTYTACAALYCQPATVVLPCTAMYCYKIILQPACRPPQLSHTYSPLHAHRASNSCLLCSAGCFLPHPCLPANLMLKLLSLLRSRRP
jgi:hypothetical protein